MSYLSTTQQSCLLSSGSELLRTRLAQQKILNCTAHQSRPVGLSRRRIQFNPRIAACFFFRHLITLSARTSTFGGIVKPICFAAFRLIMNSNFVGCSTGSQRACAFENLVHVSRGATVQIGNVRTVGHEAPGFHKFWSAGISPGAGSLPRVLQSVFAEN